MEVVSLPLTFTCLSGELLWGQAALILRAAERKKYDEEGKKPEKLKGGTVLSSLFHYRVKAEKGEWVVYLFRRDKQPLLYLACAKGENPRALYERIKRVRDGKENKGVIEVGRYSWGPAIIEEDDEDEEDDECFLQESFFPNLLDPRGAEGFRRLVENKDLPQKDSVICAGLGLRFCPEDEVDYEYAWLVFEGGKLVGFFYDVSYNSPIETERGDLFSKLEDEICSDLD